MSQLETSSDYILFLHEYHLSLSSQSQCICLYAGSGKCIRPLIIVVRIFSFNHGEGEKFSSSLIKLVDIHHHEDVEKNYHMEAD